MSDKVKPALTAEEWTLGAYHRSGDAVVVSGDALQIGEETYFTPCDDGDEYPSGAVYSFRAEHAQALAALALKVAGPHGKPLFTREHYIALMLAADGSYLNEERKALAIEAVALLESLLPPEEP